MFRLFQIVIGLLVIYGGVMMIFGKTIPTRGGGWRTIVFLKPLPYGLIALPATLALVLGTLFVGLGGLLIYLAIYLPPPSDSLSTLLFGVLSPSSHEPNPSS